MNVMEVKEVSKSYGLNKALDQLSFSIQKKSIHGLLGPNGAGKSTAMSIMAGMMAPDSGTVFIDGEPLKLSDLNHKRKVAILPEKGAFYPELTVSEFLTFIGSLYLPKNKIKKKKEHVLSLLDLVEIQERLIGNLSRGYRQRVGIAQVLMTEAEILILDEPTLGLDPQAMIKMRELLLSLKEHYTLIISSHLLHEMGQICDNVTLINKGKLYYDGSLSGLLKTDDRSRLVVKTLKHDAHIFSELDFVESVNEQQGGLNLIFTGGEQQVPKLVQHMVRNGFEITQVVCDHYSLEEAFKRTLE